MIFKGLEISVSGMGAQRIRMDTVASNLANINVTHSENGGPYKRRVPVFEAVLEGEQKVAAQRGVAEFSTVRVKKILEDNSPFRQVYEPSHPDADQNGYVAYPNVDPMREMVDMISAARSYEANLTAFNTHKDMLLKALEILRS